MYDEFKDKFEKTCLSEYYEAIPHHFCVYSLSGLMADRYTRLSFSSLLSLKFMSLFFWC